MIILTASERDGELLVNGEIEVSTYMAAVNALYRNLADTNTAAEETYWAKPRGCRVFRRTTEEEYIYYGGWSSLEPEPRGEAMPGLIVGKLEVYPRGYYFYIRVKE